MSMYSNFFRNVNRTIADEMRFVRNYQANPNGSSASGSTDGTKSNTQAQLSQMMGGLNPLTLMMMLWMMQGGSSGQAGSGDPNTTYAGYGGSGFPTPGYPGLGVPGYGLPGGFYPPVFMPSLPGFPFASPQPANPAMSYLDKLFKANTPAATDANPKPDTTLDDADVAQVKKDLASGKIKAADLGQALQWKLAQGADSSRQAVSRLITDLTDSGDLNVTPFLANNYLRALPDARRDELLSAIELSGLRMDDGKPNAQLIGFLLQNLNAKDKPETRAFLRQFMQDFQDAHGQSPDTPVGKIYSQVASLAGLTADAEGKLQFETV